MLCLTTSCLMACAPTPPLETDLSCTWTKAFDVTQLQVEAMKRDPGTWRPLAVQIKDHDDERKKRCPPS